MLVKMQIYFHRHSSNLSASMHIVISASKLFREMMGKRKTEIEKGALMLFGALIICRRAERAAWCMLSMSLTPARPPHPPIDCMRRVHDLSVCFAFAPPLFARMTKIMPVCLAICSLCAGKMSLALLLKSCAFFSSLSKLLVHMYF